MLEFEPLSVRIWRRRRMSVISLLKGFARRSGIGMLEGFAWRGEIA